MSANLARDFAFPVIALLVSLVPAAALADPPTADEQKLFDDIAGRFDAHADNANVSIAEVRASFDTEQTITVPCDGVEDAAVDRCAISVRTELEAYDEELVKKLFREKRPAAYFWRCSLEVVTEERQEVKRITCSNGVMFRASYLKPNEDRPAAQGGELGRIDNERLFYHEMLHGQLLIDAMQDDAAWRTSCCRCFPDTEGRPDLAPSDLDHAEIPDVEGEYAKETGTDAGITVIIRDKIQISDGETNPVVVTVANLSEFDKKILPFAVPIENIEGTPGPELFVDDDDNVKVRVTLVDVKKPARLMVYIDPPGVGLIELVEILPQSVLEIPALGLIGLAVLAALLALLTFLRLRHAR